MKRTFNPFKPGDVIKHKKFMDVCIYITSVGHLEIGGSEIQVSGVYMNQGFVKSWYIGQNADLTIKLTDLSKWLLCADPKADPCLRKCSWIQLSAV